MLFDGTGPSKTLTTLGINKQENQKICFRKRNSKLNQDGHLQCKMKQLFGNICFDVPPSCIEEVCVHCVCCWFVCFCFPVYLCQGWLPVCGCIKNANQILWQRGSRFLEFQNASSCTSASTFAEAARGSNPLISPHRILQEHCIGTSLRKSSNFERHRFLGSRTLRWLAFACQRQARGGSSVVGRGKFRNKV